MSVRNPRRACGWPVTAVGLVLLIAAGCVAPTVGRRGGGPRDPAGAESPSGTVLADAKKRLLTDEAAYGPASPQLVPALRALANERVKRGRHEEATLDLRRALKIMEDCSPVDPETVVDLLLDMARAIQSGGDPKEAGEWLAMAERTCEKRIGPRTAAMARVHMARADVLAASGEWEKAEGQYRECVTVLDHAVGKDSLPAAEAWLKLADVLHKRGKTSEGLDLARQALVLRRNAHGSRHPAAAEAMRRMADFYRDLGRLSEAESMVREALSIDEATFGKYDANVAQDLAKLGWIVGMRGDLAQAEASLTLALGIHTRLYGPRHPVALQNMAELASVLEHRERYGDALRLLHEVRDAQAETLAPDDPACRRLKEDCERVEGLILKAREDIARQAAEISPDAAVYGRTDDTGEVWRAAADGDFNGDGRNDLAELGRGPDGATEVTVTLRGAAKDNKTPGTTDSVQALRSGDDGEIRGVASVPGKKGSELRVRVVYTNGTQRVIRVVYAGPGSPSP